MRSGSRDDCASCVSAAPQSEYTLSDCCNSSAPAGSAKWPSSLFPAAGEEDNDDCLIADELYLHGEILV